MAVQTHYNDGGTWRRLKQLHYNDAGTWRKLKQAWYNDLGTWRKVFVGAEVSFASFDIEGEDELQNSAAAGITLFSNGSVTFTVTPADGSTTHPLPFWLTDISTGNGNDFWVRVTLVSGTFTAGAVGTWLQLSTNRSWNKSGTVPSSVVFNMQFATDAAGTNIVGTYNNCALRVDA